jgi:hypothetical protein
MEEMFDKEEEAGTGEAAENLSAFIEIFEKLHAER